MKLIVGLGNPTKEYELTRHNVGFLMLDKYLGQVKWQSKFNSLVYEKNLNNEKVLFVKPQTYMNLSGEAIIKFFLYYKLKIDDLLIISDDKDISLGKIKVKKNSSSGGHNGLKSIIETLKTDAFLRLKVGIKTDSLRETSSFVLGVFSTEELNILDEVYLEVVKKINEFISNLAKEDV